MTRPATLAVSAVSVVTAMDTAVPSRETVSLILITESVAVLKKDSALATVRSKSNKRLRLAKSLRQSLKWKSNKS